MKKWMMIIILSLLLPLSQSFVQAQETDPLQPFDKITSFLDQAGVPMDRWEIMVKQTIQYKEVSQLQEDIQNYFPNLEFTVSKGSHENVTKIIGRNPQKNNQIDETFNIIHSKGARPFTEVVYKFSSQSFDQKTRQYFQPRFSIIVDHILVDNPTIFTCIKSKASDMIDVVLFFEKFRTAFQIKPMESLREDEFISITGYTNEWNHSLPLLDKGEMNIQFAARKGMGAKTTITIGTPIIMTEY